METEHTVGTRLQRATRQSCELRENGRTTGHTTHTREAATHTRIARVRLGAPRDIRATWHERLATRSVRKSNTSQDPGPLGSAQGPRTPTPSGGVELHRKCRATLSFHFVTVAVPLYVSHSGA